MALFVNDPDERRSNEITGYFEEEHRRISNILETLLRDPGHQKWGTKVSELRMIVGDLMVAKEHFLYPNARLHAESKRYAEEIETLKQRVRELLSQLAVLSRSDAKWREGVEALQESLRQYFEEEEKNLYPVLRRLLSETERFSMYNRLKTIQENLRAAG